MTRPWVVRLTAFLAVLVVVAAGMFWNRSELTEWSTNSWDVGPDVPGGEVVVEAGEGVRVNIDGESQSTWFQVQTRATLARARVDTPGPAHGVAHCDAPTPVSRCAIWISVGFASDTRVKVLRSPGALVGGVAGVDETGSGPVPTWPNVTVQDIP